MEENLRKDVPVRITVTPRGNPAGVLYISEQDVSSFKVAIKQVPGWDGERDVTFDWIAFGTLKEYETSPKAKAEWERMMQEAEAKRQEKENSQVEKKRREEQRRQEERERLRLGMEGAR